MITRTKGVIGQGQNSNLILPLSNPSSVGPNLIRIICLVFLLSSLMTIGSNLQLSLKSIHLVISRPIGEFFTNNTPLFFCNYCSKILGDCLNMIHQRWNVQSVENISSLTNQGQVCPGLEIGFYPLETPPRRLLTITRLNRIPNFHFSLESATSPPSMP